MTVTDQTNISSDGRIVLPLPPNTALPGAIDERCDMAQDMAVYAKFMRHLRHVPNSRLEIKVLSAIQFTADMLGHSDAHVAKILVDLGLRTPRMALPADFLKFADQALMRSGFEVGGPNKALLELKGHWDQIGEDKFAAFKGEYSLVNESMLL